MPRKAAVLTFKSLGKPKECSAQRGRKSAASVAGCQTAQYVAIQLTYQTEWVRRKVKSHNIKHYAQITVSVNRKTLCFSEDISRTQPSIFRYLSKKTPKNKNTIKTAFHAASKSTSRFHPMPEIPFEVWIPSSQIPTSLLRVHLQLGKEQQWAVTT